MPLQPAANSEPHARNIKHAIDMIVRSLDLYGPDALAFSFNGGKDSTAVLHLLLSAVQQWLQAHDKDWSTTDGLAGMHVFFFHDPDEFPEVTEFVNECNKNYHLGMKTYTGSFKEGLQQMMSTLPIKGIFLGTRRGDPNCKDQEFFSPSSKGWPAFMRINAILNWTYGDVWAFLASSGAPHCRLYDQGYTSLGSVKNTVRNSALLRPDGTYAPAHLLSDDRLERAGRTDKGLKKQHSAGAEHAHTAAIVVVGDEVLSGKVLDRNSPFLASQLHALGWKVGKVSVLSDNIDAIARELQAVMVAHDVVITCGGVGPTVDDCTIEAVALAAGTHVAENSELASMLRSYFGADMTDGHMKMACTPEGSTEIIHYKTAEGKAAPFPLLKVQNAYVLPGVPQLVQSKWSALKAHLEATFGIKQKFHNRVVKVNVADEALIAAAFEALAQQFPDVSTGSYPAVCPENGPYVSISLEAKAEEQLDLAVEQWKVLLDSHPDPDIHNGCISQIDRDVLKLL